MRIILTTIGMALVAGGAIGWLVRDRLRRRNARRHMDGRQPMDDNDYGRSYYPDHADIAATVRRVMALHSRRNLSRAVPGDRLIDDLHLTDPDDPMGLEELLMHVENELDIRLPHDALEQISTFDDVMTQVIDSKRRQAMKESMA